eukprot:2372920-Rhodomonas_salina.3
MGHAGTETGYGAMGNARRVLPDRLPETPCLLVPGIAPYASSVPITSWEHTPAQYCSLCRSIR